MPYFDKALPFELALTVHGSGCGNDDLEWAQDVTPKDQKTQQAVGNYGHSLIAYRGDNYRGQTRPGPGVLRPQTAPTSPRPWSTAACAA